jgi:GNAT superfamily N-acetyltransferase
VEPRFEVVGGLHPHAVEALHAYFAELDERFTAGFDPGDAVTADAASFDPPGGAFIVAYVDDAPAACGGLVRHDDVTAEIKRMWVHPMARGRGLAKRMLAYLESMATRLGYQRVVLDTNAALTEAISMYRRSGYQATTRYNDNPYAMLWFEKSMSDNGRRASDNGATQ